jgi:hypothetical protein
MYAMVSPFTVAAAKGGAVKRGLRPILAEILSPEGFGSEMDQIVVGGSAGRRPADRIGS